MYSNTDVNLQSRILNQVGRGRRGQRLGLVGVWTCHFNNYRRKFLLEIIIQILTLYNYSLNNVKHFFSYIDNLIYCFWNMWVFFNYLLHLDQYHHHSLPLQLTASLYDFYSIFFEISLPDQMTIIKQSDLMLYEKSLLLNEVSILLYIFNFLGLLSIV